LVGGGVSGAKKKARGPGATTARRPRNKGNQQLTKPATAGDRILATPSVDACARCVVPNASLTYRSALAASLAAKAGSFFSSSL